MNNREERQKKVIGQKEGGSVNLSNNFPIKYRILARLVSARSNNQWVTITQLSKMSGIRHRNTVYKALERFLKDGLVTRRKTHPTQGRWYWEYQATEVGQLDLEQGGVPRSPSTGRMVEYKFGVVPFSDALDFEAMVIEDLRVYLTLDRYATEKLRAACDPPKKRRKGKKEDRAKQVSYSDEAFTISISKSGKATLVLRKVGWSEPLNQWMVKAGLNVITAQQFLRQIVHQIPDQLARIEIPILVPGLKKVGAQFDATINVDGEVILANINYSRNQVGLELHGMVKWIDNFVQGLGGQAIVVPLTTARLEQQLMQLSQQVEELRKEKEKREKEEAEAQGQYYT